MHKLFLLGGIDLREASGRGDTRSLLAQSKTVATLAFLALSPKGRSQRRDRVVGLLWPELDQEHARAALRKSLHVLRNTLGEDVVVARGDEEVAIHPQTLWCDAVAFSSACDEGHLAAALDEYQGELMPGFHLPDCRDFDLWLEERRRDLSEKAVSAAWAMAQRLEQEKKMTLASTWAKRAVQYAGTDERVLRRTMTMLERLGDQAGALRVFRDFSHRLQLELDAKPSAESRALADKMRGT